MSLAVWIPADWQYGDLAPGEAREGALRQAVAQAIKRTLFGDPDTGTAFDRLLLRFARALQPDIPATRPAAARLWALLLPDDGPALVSLADADAVPKEVTAAFCFCTHALCSTVALEWIRHEDGRDDEDGPLDDLGPALDELLAVRDRPYWAEYARVLSEIQAWLRQASWRWLRDDAADEAVKAEDLRLVAAVLLSALLVALDEWFAVETGAVTSRDGRAHTPKYVILRQPALAARIEFLLAELPLAFTLHLGSSICAKSALGRSCGIDV